MDSRNALVRKSIRVLPAVIERNLMMGEEEPPIVVRVHNGWSHAERKARVVEIDGPSRVVWDRNGVPGSGAHVWVETDAPVRLDGEVIA